VPVIPASLAAAILRLWRHVYHAYRSMWISACKTLTGTVEDVRQEARRDTHIL